MYFFTQCNLDFQMSLKMFRLSLKLTKQSLFYNNTVESSY